MTCFFCGDPAAHPTTGCVYSERVLACAACTRRLWAWLLPFVNGKGRRKGGPSFYEAAGRIP